MAGGEPVVAVVGGGVSGLAAARVLAGLSGGAAARVVLFEASGRLGGKVQTGVIGDVPVELGPDQFLRRDPSAERLCRQLGLGEDLIEPAARGAAVYSRGAMRALPPGLVLGVPTNLDAVAASGIVSADGIEQARKASTVSAEAGVAVSAEDVGLGDGDGDGATESEELSVGDILRPRLGDEVVDRLVDPLLGGINAGSVDHLSLAVAAPQIAAALVGRSDPVEALRPLVGAPRASAGSDPAAGGGGGAPPGGGAAVPASPFFGLRGGLSRMIDACAAELAAAAVDVRTGTAVTAIRRAGDRSGRLEIEDASGHVLTADGVVIALPAYAAAPLLADLVPSAADELAGITYASVAVLTLAYPAGALNFPVDQTGVLVPRAEGLLMTAASWLSVKWPWMSSATTEIVRVSAGRAGDERIEHLADDDLACELAGEVERVLGCEAHPHSWQVTRWPRSFPQYRPGHRALVARLTGALFAEPRVEVAGALLGGIGIPACITSGETAAERLGGRLWS